MITENYVSFEVAKLLKEKGFNEKVSRWYVANSPQEGVVTIGFGDKQLYINAPTQQMAMKWLREVHNLHIMVNCVGRVNYDPIIQRFDGKDFEIEGVEVGTTRRINGKWEDVRRGFKSYEEACEAAIKYCLENLI